MKAVRKEKREYDALKPTFGSRGQPPFYDPNDLHAHVWHKGKLGTEDDPKSPIYNKDKLSIRDCVYCKICHKIQDNFQSTVGDNKDIVENTLESVLEEVETPGYHVNSAHNMNEEVNLTPLVPLDPLVPKILVNNERLFLASEGIIDGNYVKVTESNESNESNEAEIKVV